jgi:hypothetical protein
VSVLWLAPTVWGAIALVLVPIVIHLLTRQRSRRVLFPSLRFLPAAQLAALRRRTITDWPLLAVRVLIIVTAVAAMAAPVLISDARRDDWDRRVARAILTTHDADDVARLVKEESAQSFASVHLPSPSMPDALRAAAEWLREQPPATREVVIIGDLRERVITRRDLELLPAYVGIRFLPVPQADRFATDEVLARGENEEGRVTTFQVRVTPEASVTRAQYTTSMATAEPAIQLVASAQQQPYADAMLRAVLRDGVILDHVNERAVTIAFDGATFDSEAVAPPTEPWMRGVLETSPDLRGGEAGGTLMVRAGMSITDTRAPEVVAGVVRATYAPLFETLEPRRISPTALAAWSRPSSGAPSDARPADEGDRRWFWGTALLLLLAEQFLRGRGRGV